LAVNFKPAQNASPEASSSSYYIIPPEGGEPIRYRRVSKFISVLGDNENLVRRDMRYAAVGAVKYYSTAINELDIESDKQELDKVIERAARKAGKWDAADYGTAVHAWTEDTDNGVPFARGSHGRAVSALKWGPERMFKENYEDIYNDVAAYTLLAEAHGLKFERAEATIVLDEYHVAGTLDRLGYVAEWSPAYCCDKKHVLDVKTGSVDFGRMEKTMQFAAYAKSKLYNHNTGERTEHGACLKTAYIIHLPARKARPSLIPVPLERGLIRLDMAHEIWEERKRKHMWKVYNTDVWITSQIESITTEDELTEFYYRTSSLWTEDHAEQATNKAKEF